MNLQRLGKRQKEALAKMCQGFWISIVRDNRDMSVQYNLTNDADTYSIRGDCVASLINRGLFVHRDATMCLEIDIDEYRNKPEYREAICHKLGSQHK